MMSQADFLKISGLIFLVVGSMHLFRAYQEWEMLINGWPLPVWASWVVGVFLVVLSMHAFKFAKEYRY